MSLTFNSSLRNLPSSDTSRLWRAAERYLDIKRNGRKITFLSKKEIFVKNDVNNNKKLVDAIKVISYIFSVGIAPLIAFIIVAYNRSKFQIKETPVINEFSPSRIGKQLLYNAVNSPDRLFENVFV